MRSYLDSREDLKKLFCEVDLVLMPSRTDGFGLTGLEALSAGLPVIISKNSGFGEALGMHYVALYLSLILKIPVIGEKPSSASGTKTECNNLRRLRMSKVPMGKNTVGLNNAKVSLKRC